MALALGIGGGIVGERQAVVQPCVRTLDAYQDTVKLVGDALHTSGSDEAALNDLFARAGAIRARREAEEKRCRG